MLALGIGLGILAFFIVGSTVGEIATHNPQAGGFPGLVAALWAAWPFFHKGRVQRYNFLHPVPRRYNVAVKQAFSKVRTVLDEKTYNFGDQWKVPTADTQGRRIHAVLRFTEEETHMEPGGRPGEVHMRKQRVQRLLELDVQMKEEPNDSTVIQFDFYPKVEGMQFAACDGIVSGILNDVEATLGAGTDAGNPMATSLPAPPWWLLGVTALALLMLAGDVISAVFK